MIGVSVRIDDMGDPEILLPGPLDEDLRRIRRIDQDTLFRLAVREQVPEVPVTACSDLFEHQLHDDLSLARLTRSTGARDHR